MSKCKICGGELSQFLSLGQQPIANAFLKKEDLKKKEYMFELATGFCNDCKMTQLVNTVQKEKLFNENYAYYSSVSITMENHFKEYANLLIKKFSPKDKELIIEIGCNDGIMIKNFDRKKFKVLGIEPSTNVANAARAKGIEVIDEFFDTKLANKVLKTKGKAKIIYAANVICHIESIHELVKGIAMLLDDKGVFAFEEPYLIDITEKNAYDQIYDEHVWFFSIMSLSNLFKKYNLEIFDVERQTTHGGSMRYYVAKQGAYKLSPEVDKGLKLEKSKGLDKLETYQNFAKEVEKSKKMLVDMLTKIKKDKKRIVGYAASSKGTVVLNYCNIGNDFLEYISDNTPTKQGLYSPGKHIPIVNPDEFHKNPPEYAILLAWNYAEEIKKKEKDSGVKFIVHIPYARIL